MRIGLLLLTLMMGAHIGNAAIASVTTLLENDAIEICHRQGGTPETCGDLPMDDL